MNRTSTFLILALAATVALPAAIPLPKWKHLSSRTGDLPQPNGGIQQTTGFSFDIDGDGHLDIFTAEMGQWNNKPGSPPDDPKCRAWILYGDGRGGFTTTVLSTGIGYHEARVADLDGDGDLDIFNKPYRFDTPRVDVWLNQGNGPAKQ